MFRRIYKSIVGDAAIAPTISSNTVSRFTTGTGRKLAPRNGSNTSTTTGNKRSKSATSTLAQRFRNSMLKKGGHDATTVAAAAAVSTQASATTADTTTTTPHADTTSNTPTTAYMMRESAKNSVRLPIASVFPPTADTATIESKAGRVNMKPRCGSTLSANPNYHHWYLHAYGLPSQFVDEALAQMGDRRDLEQMIKLQTANPMALHNPFTAVAGEAPTPAEDNANGNNSSSSSSNTTSTQPDAATIARQMHNANHAHWFKHQYCLPNWEIRGSLMEAMGVEEVVVKNGGAKKKGGKKATTGASSASSAYNCAAPTTSPTNAQQQQPPSFSSPSYNSFNCPAHQAVYDRNNLEFSMRVQHATLDPHATSKLFNLH